MRLFGFEISRGSSEVAEQKAAPGESAVPVAYGGGYSGTGFGSWFGGIVREPFTGAWQRNIVMRPETVLSFHAVFACVTLIASDISKLRIKLVERDGNGIWNETTSPAFSPLLAKPNNYQNRIQFIESWITSKLVHGNAYILKERDGRGVVVGLSVLDPVRTKPLVAPDGSVYYQLNADWLAGVEESPLPVPASEIIHDRMNALYHPLVGISPLYACGLPASQGLNIQRNSTSFFANGARPGGVLTAPGKINNDTANRIKEHWQGSYTGQNAGNVAVLGDGLTYSSMVMNAVDSQLIDQLKMSAEQVCSTFHVPPFMVGLAELPARVAVEAFNQQYYTQCLQHLIEAFELCLDEGLNLVNVQGHSYGTELDLDGLLRMDQASQFKAYGDAILAGLMKPNEGRNKINLPPADGGDEVYLQQQNYSLAALAKRDAQADPFGTNSASTDATPPLPDGTPAASSASTKAAQTRRASVGIRKAVTAHVTSGYSMSGEVSDDG